MPEEESSLCQVRCIKRVSPPRSSSPSSENWWAFKEREGEYRLGNSERWTKSEWQNECRQSRKTQTYRLKRQHHFILDAILFSESLFLLQVAESSKVIGRIWGDAGDDACTFAIFDVQHGQGVDWVVRRQWCFQGYSHDVLSTGKIIYTHIVCMCSYMWIGYACTPHVHLCVCVCMRASVCVCVCVCATVPI